ncbi:MAG: protease inhibitor I42 family protein, partial [Victivallales bacterium]|nr:protease inhibitor I42 family protein [Victivallales bacterium]
LMRYNLRPGDKVIFYLEENTTTGYTWFARHDPYIVDVDIEHQGRGFLGFVGGPGRAEIKIRGRREGFTVVELVYARSWEWTNGAAPAKVVQIFIDSER